MLLGLTDSLAFNYAFTAFLLALAACGIGHLLSLTTPRPRVFFSWIVGLVTVAAMVVPFAGDASLGSRLSTAVINLVVGLAVASSCRPCCRAPSSTPSGPGRSRDARSGARHWLGSDGVRRLGPRPRPRASGALPARPARGAPRPGPPHGPGLGRRRGAGPRRCGARRGGRGRLRPGGPRPAVGSPWSTWWFEITGAVPAAFAGEVVEVVVDLGFTGEGPGFQAEGLLHDADGVPLKGIHPQNRWHRVSRSAAGGERVHLYLEAAGNPALMDDGFRPTPSATWRRRAASRATASAGSTSPSSTRRCLGSRWTSTCSSTSRPSSPRAMPPARGHDGARRRPHRP